MTEDWTKWESLVINGEYPLRRFHTRSDHSVVFLTEYTKNPATDAVIKLIPADPTASEAQLVRWKAAAALSHPHLIRIFDVGRCQLGGHPFLFVVMEYAEQTLAQILPTRALNLEEVQALLPPTIDALAFLHGRNLAHGGLKPPNFLVVNDQLKLASDRVQPIDLKDGPTAAGDIRSLGATLIEALTQHPPDESAESTSLPDALPSAFADTLRRCLSANPADRPTIANLDAQLKGAPPPLVLSPPPAATVPPRVTVAPGPPVAAVASCVFAPAAPASTPTLPRKRLWVSVIAAALVLFAVAWAGSRLFHGQPKAPQPAISTAPPEAQPAAPAATAASAPPIPVPPSVVHQEMPDVSRRARASIRGTIKVSVRVSVDRSGKVTAQTLENRGSSRYFARVAGDAAMKWRFAPDSQDSRRWLLQFEFSRDGTAAHGVPRP
ncbi:MAG: hypothetical protein ABJD53_16430 [Gammaproteobacteria bacterium]